MSIEDQIFDIAKNRLEDSRLPGMFRDKGLKAPSLGEVRPCNYYTDGYEVPINVEYENQALYAGSFMISPDCKKYYVPDPDSSIGIFMQSLRLIEEEKNIKRMEHSIMKYQSYKKHVDMFLQINNFIDYDDFCYSVRKQ